MPYLAHFGLKEHPFTLTPNTNQYYPLEKHVEIIESIQFGIARNSGILKVVGDVGTGKTMLCRLLLRKLIGANEAVAYLNAPQVDPEGLIDLVTAEFGLETGSKAQMLQTLNIFLLEQHALGRNTVLIVDEAQALGAKGLEAVRLLSNLETERNKLLQIVMFGQSELDELLAQPGLRQISQRIGFAFNTGPLTMDEAVDYIAHRVKVSRTEGANFPVFSTKAMERLAEAASFVPRVINILADKALLVGYGEGATQVAPRHVDMAVKDTPHLSFHSTGRRRWARRVLVGVAAAVPPVAIILLLMFNANLQGWMKNQLGRINPQPARSAPVQPPQAQASPPVSVGTTQTAAEQ